MVSILGLFPSSHCALFIALSLLSKRLTQETAGTHFMIKKNMTCPWEGSSIAPVSRRWCICFYGYIEKLKIPGGRISRALNLKKVHRIHQTKVIARITWNLRTICIGNRLAVSEVALIRAKISTRGVKAAQILPCFGLNARSPYFVIRDSLGK